MTGDTEIERLRAEVASYQETLRGEFDKREACDREVERLRAEQSAETLPCGHPANLLLWSAETGEPLYCELCDAQSARRDAESVEASLRAELAESLKVTDTWVKTAGDFKSELVKLRAELDALKKQEPAVISPVVRTAPGRIYLVIGEECPDDANFNDLDLCGGVTWCADKIDHNSIGYVRADLAPQPAIPDGWQLVPKEPTTVMINAGQCGCMDNDVTAYVYRAMLAVAPKPGDAK